MNMELGSPPPGKIGNIVIHSEIPLVTTFADILKGVQRATIAHMPPYFASIKVYRVKIEGS